MMINVIYKHIYNSFLERGMFVKKKLTLIELIVVVIAISILAAIVMVSIGNFGEKSKITSLKADINIIQTATDLYHSKKDSCPSGMQPKIGMPEPIDFDMLHPNFIKKMPKDLDAFYWVDQDCTVYGSLIDAPKDVDVDEPSGRVTWTKNLKASTGHIYKVNKSSTINYVEKDNTGEYAGKPETDYLVSEEDEHGLETPPVGESYLGYPAKEVVTGPLVPCSFEGYICINTHEELAKIGKDPAFPLSGKYRLGENIDLTSYPNWTPIFKRESDSPFTGTFDGNGFIIKNLTINANGGYAYGLFGYTNNGAHILNITMRNVNVSGKNNDRTGSLIGIANETTIENIDIQGSVYGDTYVGGVTGTGTETIMRNVHFVGKVTGEDEVGGLGGCMYEVVISDSHFSGRVFGTSLVGGLFSHGESITSINSYAIGNIEATSDYTGGLISLLSADSLISENYFEGTVRGTQWTGGLIGSVGYVSIKRPKTIIKNSYSRGIVMGTDEVGGLIGSAMDIDIENSYSVARTTGDNSSQMVNGFIGSAQNVNVKDSYWSSELSDQSFGAYHYGLNSPTPIRTDINNTQFGLHRTAVELKKEITYENWNFTDIWTIKDGSDYPELR